MAQPSFSKENLQKLVTARMVTSRSAEAVTRLMDGEQPEAIIAFFQQQRKQFQVTSSTGALAVGPAATQRRVHSGEPSKTTLFVANLPFIVNDEQLGKLFMDHHPKEARVALRSDNRSRGYGFVTFENETDMQAALKALDKKTVEGREISVRVVLGNEKKVAPKPRAPQEPRSVRPSRIPRVSRPVASGEPSKTVAFFGNLSYGVDDAKLGDLLRGYKLASPARVSLRQDGRNLGFALVTFETPAEQARAIQSLNNTMFEGRQLNVAPSTRGPRPTRPPAAGTEASKTTLFVANLPYIVDDAGLLQIFEGFQVKEAHVPRRRNGLSCGYGFVTLASETEAQRAEKEVNKSLVEKREISVRPAFNRPALPAAAPATPTSPSAQ